MRNECFIKTAHFFFFIVVQTLQVNIYIYIPILHYTSIVHGRLTTTNHFFFFHAKTLGL